MSADTKDLLINLQPVCIIDDDQMMADLVADLVAEMGAAEVVVCPDGAAAWEKIQTTEFKLIIMDWKMPRLAGPGLFNRLRQSERFRRIPVVVMSALLKKEDFALLEEYPFTHSLSKPFTYDVLADKVTQLHSEDEWYRQNESKIASLLEKMKYDRPAAMTELMGLFSASKHTTRLALLAAVSMRRAGFLSEAAILLEHLRKLTPDSVLMMSELGRVYLASKSYSEAEELLKSAQALSPKNVERLCMIGEAQLSLGKSNEAKSSFSNALTIDPDSDKARDGIILCKNLADTGAANTVESIHRSFASLMNSVAITLVRQNKIDDGIQQYRSAMNLVDDSDSKSRLAFNLGMAYLRLKRPQDAIVWFRQAETESKGTLEKAGTYAKMCSRLMASPGAVAPIQLPDDVFIEFKD